MTALTQNPRFVLFQLLFRTKNAKVRNPVREKVCEREREFRLAIPKSSGFGHGIMVRILSCVARHASDLSFLSFLVS